MNFYWYCYISPFQGLKLWTFINPALRRSPQGELLELGYVYFTPSGLVDFFMLYF
jgi:hypothetical protein